MSESDYQRGLRGGPCRVSISDWERYSDWKAGHDAYESEQEARDEENIMQLLTPEEKMARIAARIKEREIKEARSYQIRQELEIDSQKKDALNKRKEREEISSFAIAALFFVIGFCKGCGDYMDGVNGPGYIGDKGKYFLYPVIYPIIGAFVGWLIVKIIFALNRISK